jgi:hypothetical protein
VCNGVANSSVEDAGHPHASDVPERRGVAATVVQDLNYSFVLKHGAKAPRALRGVIPNARERRVVKHDVEDVGEDCPIRTPC